MQARMHTHIHKAENHPALTREGSGLDHTQATALSAVGLEVHLWACTAKGSEE